MQSLRSLLYLAVLLAMPLASCASESITVAKADRHLWSEPVNSATNFDKASRAAILVYSLNLQNMQMLSEREMLAAFKIKSVNRDSVQRWLDKELTLSLQNYQLAAKNCAANDWTCVGTVAKTKDLLTKGKSWASNIPDSFQAWHSNLNEFVRTYLAEQMRLAALFPKVSSEIDFFNANEWNGDNFADRQFLLTFDDGPSAVQGDTDKVLAMLAATKKTAIFFVLGENFQRRLTKTNPATLASLYQNQCVALHGWEHQSHAKWMQWQTSVLRTQSLVQAVFADKTQIFLPLFRPPYGQRKADSGAFFQQHGLQIALWNLDSQDWNHQVNAEDIINRMITLMLIKRHGVVLFHDIHPKANLALPSIINELGGAVNWVDCHHLPSK